MSVDPSPLGPSRRVPADGPGEPSLSDQPVAIADTINDPADLEPSTTDQDERDSPFGSVGDPPPGQSLDDAPRPSVTTTDLGDLLDIEGWNLLRIWAANLADAQAARISFDNRIRAGKADKALFVGLLKAAKNQEAEATKGMLVAYDRVVPVTIQRWQEEAKGVGIPTLARFLGEVGHPALALPMHFEPNPKFDDKKPASEENPSRLLIQDEPYLRTVGQFRAYCGFGDPANKRKKGMTVEDAAKMGRPNAKMLVWLIIRAVVMNGKGGDYREEYEAAKLHYDETHPEDWTPKHRDNAARRKMGKAILHDLWRVSRDDLAERLRDPNVTREHSEPLDKAS